MGRKVICLRQGGSLIHFPVPSSSPSPDPEQNAWEKEMKWRVPWVPNTMFLLCDSACCDSCCYLTWAHMPVPHNHNVVFCQARTEKPLIWGELAPQQDSQWPITSLSCILAAPAIKGNGKEPRIWLFWCKSLWLSEGIDLTLFPFIWQGTLFSFTGFLVCIWFLKVYISTELFWTEVILLGSEIQSI